MIHSGLEALLLSRCEEIKETPLTTLLNYGENLNKWQKSAKTKAGIIYSANWCAYSVSTRGWICIRNSIFNKHQVT